MHRYRYLYRCIATLACVFLLANCVPVKPYQKMYLNDHEMQFGQAGAGQTEENVQTYREGATGAGNTKTSGGCGCN